MLELDKHFSRVQTRQAVGKAIKEIKDQLMQEELSNALIKARFSDERQKLECSSIQQYRARVVKLRRKL